jgi:hypothetical protein
MPFRSSAHGSNLSGVQKAVENGEPKIEASFSSCPPLPTGGVVPGGVLLLLDVRLFGIDPSTWLHRDTHCFRSEDLRRYLSKELRRGSEKGT